MLHTMNNSIKQKNVAPATNFSFLESSLPACKLSPDKKVNFNINWQDYIISDNQVLLGKPTIKGTRISVELVLELFSAGWTEKQVLDSYPMLTSESLRAVFLHLKDCIQQELYFPVSVE